MGKHYTFLVLLSFSLLSVSFPSAQDSREVGYLPWKSAKPALKVTIDSKTTLPIDAVVYLRCPGADLFKIANDPAFKGAEWRKMVSRQKWKFDEKDRIVSIFTKFKKTGREGEASRVTPVVSYSFDRENLNYKIERYNDNGYINWTMGYVHIKVVSSYKAKTGERYNIDKAQEMAENEIYIRGYDILKNISVNYFYKVNDVLKMDRKLYNKMNVFLKNIKIMEIKYLSRESVMLEGNLPFAGKTGRVPDLTFLVLGFNESKTPRVSDLYDTVFQSLVLDVRGLDFHPSLFPSVVTEKDETILDISQFTNHSEVFVRYIRDLDREGGYQKPGTVYKNQLFIKALELTTEDKSKIVVTERNRQLMMANKKTHNNLLNGNFFVLLE